MQTAEKEQTKIFRLSDRYPEVQVMMRVRMSLPGIQIWQVGIGVPPSIPESLLEPLWSRSGISLGVHSGLGDKTHLFSATSIEIDFPVFQVSVDLEQLSDDEIVMLAKELEGLTHRIVVDLVSESNI